VDDHVDLVEREYYRGLFLLDKAQWINEVIALVGVEKSPRQTRMAMQSYLPPGWRMTFVQLIDRYRFEIRLFEPAGLNMLNFLFNVEAGQAEMLTW